MNEAEWILVIFLSVALLVFLILATVLVYKLIDITKEAKKIIISGQNIAKNVEDLSSVGGVVKHFTEKFTEAHKSHKKK
jgi:biopolymer transport protein ExbB/TolQ